jgi:hypothetical protein
MYKNVRRSNQRRRNAFVVSKAFSDHSGTGGCETKEQRRLRLLADEWIGSRAMSKLGPKLERGFKQSQAKERDRVFYASYEWYEFRLDLLHRHSFKCACGVKVRAHHVRHIQSLRTHFHLRLNPINILVQCDACAPRIKRPVKRERL